MPSSQCRVKIVAHRASGATRENTSGIFSISSLSVGGFFPYEVWRIDRPHTVTWTYAGVSVGSFDLLVGKDVAGPWTTLATALPAATRSLDWTPDATWIGVAYFKVIARASGGTSLIESVSHFVRVDCFDVMVTSPTPGSYESGMSMQIQSSVDGSCGSVTSTYSVSRDGGASVLDDRHQHIRPFELGDHSAGILHVQDHGRGAKRDGCRRRATRGRSRLRPVEEAEETATVTSRVLRRWGCLSRRGFSAPTRIHSGRRHGFNSHSPSRRTSTSSCTTRVGLAPRDRVLENVLPGTGNGPGTERRIAEPWCRPASTSSSSAWVESWWTGSEPYSCDDWATVSSEERSGSHHNGEGGDTALLAVSALDARVWRVTYSLCFD